MNKLKSKILWRRGSNVVKAIDVWGLRKRFMSCLPSRPPVVGPERQLDSALKVLMDWPEDVRKPLVGLVRDADIPTPYWPKYERFLVNNRLTYEYLDIHRSDFWQAANKFDVIVWHTHSAPAQQWEAKSKIHLLETTLRKTCLPSRDEMWFYEDKVRQQWLFGINNIPHIQTFASYSYEEAMDYVQSCRFPIVSKEATNSGSEGVCLLTNRRKALSFCKSVFGRGRSTLISYLRQKDYVCFQELVPNHGYDLRVIVIGNSYFGYYRHVPKDDFRASGAGIFTKDRLPEEAMRLAAQVKKSLPASRMLAVDLLKDRRDDKFYVIEVSIFICVDTCEQLKVDGVPGRYIFENDVFRFEQGRYWVQELTMKELMTEWIEKTRTHAQ